MSVKHLQGGNQHTPGFSGIHIKASHRGLLHSKLGVPSGKKIPINKIKAAENSGSSSLRKEAQFADNARKFNH